MARPHDEGEGLLGRALHDRQGHARGLCRFGAVPQSVCHGHQGAATQGMHEVKVPRLDLSFVSTRCERPVEEVERPARLFRRHDFHFFIVIVVP